MDAKTLKKVAKLIRYHCLVMGARAGSGHLSSALSATELMTGLMFGGAFRFDPDNPAFRNNDRLIFSKGHASMLLYSLWAAAGKVGEKELLTFRKFGSPLEGHPTTAFPFTEAAGGSLGQGLSVGVGMALSAKYLDKLSYRAFVLLGDGEMAEGSVWEAIQIAAHYKLDNLIGILDVNRLGQRGETMYGHDLGAYEKRLSAFGWRTIKIEDGHDFEEIHKAFSVATTPSPQPSPARGEGEDVGGRPVMIIAKTIKGKGISFMENKGGWHGKVLKDAELSRADVELGGVDKKVRGKITPPPKLNRPSAFKSKNFLAPQKTAYALAEPVATRKAYGNALVRIALKYRDMVVLDSEVSNSTFSETFKKLFPDLFFEMYIAEQNMVGTALGLARRGKIPFVSTFSAFFSRAVDQIRMSAYSGAHIVFCGSHAGVSVGEDGPSQMGLEDLAIFRSIWNSIVFYPCDAVATDKLVEEAAKYHNIVYIRTTRKATPVIYSPKDSFMVGGSKVLKSSGRDSVTVVTAGITVHEALAAYAELAKEKIFIRVVDAYSIKPLDVKTLKKAARETKAIITVEDHYPEGGLGEAVLSGLNITPQPPLKVRGGEGKICSVHILAVRKLPKSGKPAELLDYEGISAKAIVKKVKEILA